MNNEELNIVKINSERRKKRKQSKAYSVNDPSTICTNWSMTITHIGVRDKILRY